MSSVDVTPIRRIAFVGLGRMGAPMAARLIASRFDLRLVDIDPTVVSAFAASHGGTPCADIAEACRGADSLVTMLPSDAAVRAALLGPEGAEVALAPGSTAIDMSTSSPVLTREVGRRLGAAGIDFVDAPVMGGVSFAQDGTLEIMAGGEASAVVRCGEVFAAVGRHVYACGGTGTGHTLKALANFVNTATLTVFIEAMTIGRASGLDDRFMADALATLCTGRQHPLAKKIVPHVLTGRFATGMAIGLTAKDLTIAAAIGPDIGTAMPIAAAISELWERAAADLGPQVDHTEMARWWPGTAAAAGSADG